MDKIAETAVRGASTYDGGVYITVIVIVGLFILAGICIWKIFIPASVAARENSAKLTEATIAISDITSESFKATVESAARIARIEQDTQRALACAGPIIAALDKIAKTNPSLDISSELGEMRGAIKLPERRQ